jgi:hypothetical protein
LLLVPLMLGRVVMGQQVARRMLLHGQHAHMNRMRGRMQAGWRLERLWQARRPASQQQQQQRATMQFMKSGR